MTAHDLPDDVSERLAAHVAAVIRRSAIPSRERADVEEELAGHLEERYRSARAAGQTPDAAASEAIRGFGAADVVGPAFIQTFHSPLWASTIGQLLPIAAGSESAPGAVTWAIRFTRLLAILNGLAAVAIAVSWSPVRAVISAGLLLLGAVVLWLAAEGLRRRQSWATPVVVVNLLLQAATFFVTLFPPGGGWNISLNGIAGLILLLWLANSHVAIDAWTAGSRSVASWLQAATLTALLASAAVAVVGSSLPDPTLIGPDDLSAVASVTCAVGTADTGDTTDTADTADTTDAGEPLIPAPTVVLDVTYRRVDAWPRGLVNSNNGWGDTIGMDVTPVPAGVLVPTAIAVGGPGSPDTPVDVSTIIGDDKVASMLGQTVSVFDEIDSPSVVGEILGVDQRAGRTIRVTIPTSVNIGDGREFDELGTPLPAMGVNIRLAHLDRFVLVARLGCGETGPLGVNGRS
jgi:hypothetical protein